MTTHEPPKQVGSQPPPHLTATLPEHTILSPVHLPLQLPDLYVLGLEQHRPYVSFENCSVNPGAENVIKLPVPFKMNIQQHGDKISG